MVAQTCNPRTGEVDSGGLGVQSHPWLHRRLEDSSQLHEILSLNKAKHKNGKREAGGGLKTWGLERRGLEGGAGEGVLQRRGLERRLKRGDGERGTVGDGKMGAREMGAAEWGCRGL